MPKLIFDIETIGEDFDKLDKTTQEVLTEDSRAELGFSPLTGEIAAIGVLDCDKKQGAVYYQAPGQRIKDFTEKHIKFRAMPEKQMLKQFWLIAKNCQALIGFNSRAFDAPFLIIRSAIHKIKPSINLMPYRYSQETNHIDLLDHLTFYNAMRVKSSLHLWCHAFGIKSPKAQGVAGDNVALLFKEKKFLDIAKYNVRDLHATKELYQYWEKYVKP